MKLTSFCHVGAWQVKDFIFFHCQPPEGIVLPIGGFLPDVFVEIFSRERTVVVLSVDQIRQVGLKFFRHVDMRYLPGDPIPIIFGGLHPLDDLSFLKSYPRLY